MTDSCCRLYFYHTLKTRNTAGHVNFIVTPLGYAWLHNMHIFKSFCPIENVSGIYMRICGKNVTDFRK